MLASDGSGRDRRGRREDDGLRSDVARRTSASPTRRGSAAATRGTSRSSGDAGALHESWGFSVGDNGASRVGDLLWFGPLKRFQKLFFHTPLVNLFIMGSEVYHDYYRWPMRDRRVFEEWLAKTEWGRLFQEYAKRGVLAPQATPR